MAGNHAAPLDAYRWHCRAGLIAGPALFAVLLALPAPAGLSDPAWNTAALALWMAIWWMSEAVPLAVTALLPVLLFPLMGVISIAEATAPYADPLIFLFLGGFLLALALQRWGLDRRIALVILGVVGERPQLVVAGLMLATAFLSLWISNTATAMTMLPIGQSILATMRRCSQPTASDELDKFSASVMLGIAYAASIGGMGSLIGTPPNALLAGYLREAHGIEIGFAQWFAIGLPTVAILLPITWLWLVRIAFPFEPRALTGHRAALAAERATLAPMSRGECMVAIIFALTALAWITRPLVQDLTGLVYSDPAIAIAAGILLFVIPVERKDGRFLLTWRDTANLPWHVLILFGGGLSLAQAIDGSGLALAIGNSATGFAAMPPILFVAALGLLIVALSELASNTAIAAVFLPVAGALAFGIGADPVLLAVTVALMASLGFMLPVGTPPNAIVYGSGAVAATQMLRAGAPLDLIGIAVVTLIAWALGPALFG
ncbi:MAG: DASS family sodium-coupled anion symporter [Dongiaceae bacterium]